MKTLLQITQGLAVLTVFLFLLVPAILPESSITGPHKVITFIAFLGVVLSSAILSDIDDTVRKAMRRTIEDSQYTIDYQVQQLEFYKKQLKDERLERFIKDATAETKELNSSITDSKIDAHDA